MPSLVGITNLAKPCLATEGSLMAKGSTEKAAKKADTANQQSKKAVDGEGAQQQCGHEHGHEHGHNPGQPPKVEVTRIVEREEALRKLESDLSKREIGLIEREIKILSLQQEIDRLRPLSGLYRVVKAMATERKLES